MSKCVVPVEHARESFRARLPNAPARRPGGRRPGTTARRSNIEGAAPNATQSAPGSSLPWSPSKSARFRSLVRRRSPDVVLGQTCQKLTIASMPADNGCTGRLRSCRTNVQAFWASRGSESGLCSANGRMRSETCAISPTHSSARARGPDNEPGKDTGSPRRAPVPHRTATAAASTGEGIGRNCNSLGQGCPRLSCPAGTTYEFLMPPPSSWGVHCAC